MTILDTYPGKTQQGPSLEGSVHSLQTVSKCASDSAL